MRNLHLTIAMLIALGYASYEPVQVTKCDPVTGMCVTYYENCLTLNLWRR
jgi:hypothetical protein